MDFNVCSFCDRRVNGDESLIQGKNGCICFKCAQQVSVVSKRQEMLHRKENESNPITVNWRDFTPHSLKQHLDQFVIGHEEAKKRLCVAVYNHYKRLALKKETPTDNVEVEKSNMIFLGETGVGKTFLLKTIAQKLQVPFCIVDAKSITQVGYAGDDPEIMLSRLLQVANFNIEAAEWGIIFIDEIDKITSNKENLSTGYDLGKHVQQAILKMVEGSITTVSPEGNRRHPDQRTVNIDTKNILFICGGAFEGIHGIIKKRLEVASIGFQRKMAPYHQEKEEELLKYITPQDLREFGLIPELIGRFPIIVHLNSLTKELIKKILTEPQNAILKQYQKLFLMEDINLTFSPSALDVIVEDVVKHKLGARSLRSTLEKILQDAMFELPGQKRKGNTYLIDEEYVKRNLQHNKEQQEKDISKSTNPNNYMSQLNNT